MMGLSIDREKVIKGLIHCTAWAGLHECQPKVGDDCPYVDEADCKLTLMEDTLVLLKEQPEIVRCKDCINCVKEPNGELYCDILAVGYEPLGSKKVNGDWFCADGERR